MKDVTERLRYVGRDTESFAWLVPTHPKGMYESQVHFMDEKTKAFPGLGVQQPGVQVWSPVHGQISPLPFLPFLCPHSSPWGPLVAPVSSSSFMSI